MARCLAECGGMIGVLDVLLNNYLLHFVKYIE